MVMGNLFTTETRRVSFENKLESSFARIEKEYLKECKILKAAATKKQDEGGGESQNNVEIELSEAEMSIEEPCNETSEFLNNDEEELPPRNLNENDNEIESNIAETTITNQEKCISLRSKMLECYEINQQYPLRCSEIVNDFNKCILSYRVQEE